MVETGRISEFESLFTRFVTEYLLTRDGEHHLAEYAHLRASAETNFRAICQAADEGQDITQTVLLKLLPYNDNASNHQKGAWIHLAPAITADIVKWYENAGRTDASDWPDIAGAILRFVRQAVDRPEGIAGICQKFVALPYTKGFQSGMLSPILNALVPDKFLLINAKSSKTIDYFGNLRGSTALIDYPKVNAGGWALLDKLGPIIQEHTIRGTGLGDVFDMFGHWLVAIQTFDFGSTSYWKISPGEQARLWEDWRDGGYISIGWEALGDLSGVSRREFEERSERVCADIPHYKPAGTHLVWLFAHIAEGDRVVANRGTTQITGIGTVTGPYYFVPDEEYGHRLPVVWDDVRPRQVDQGGWRKSLIKLSRETFESAVSAPTTQITTDGHHIFTSKTFDLLASLHREPTKDFYTAHKREFAEYLELPFRGLLQRLAQRLPPDAHDALETQKNLCSRILKNDYGRGGTWDFYWGAFYPKDAMRTHAAQLYVVLYGEFIAYGFYLGNYARDDRVRLARRCTENSAAISAYLGDVAAEYPIQFSRQPPEGGPNDPVTSAEWVRDPAASDFEVRVVQPKDDVLKMTADDLVDSIARTFQALYPLILLATTDQPIESILVPNGIEPKPNTQPVYPIEQLVSDTGLRADVLERWIRAIQRKRHAIIAGPPGTGKTWVADHLTRHLIGGGDGFMELVQFHPSYSYEDFIEGIRPSTRPDGSLAYTTMPGRFLEFCRRARSRESPCVLIIDEINRANLSRVFGELMYLLEYRDREIALMDGTRFGIPKNVLVLGTMNTADRGIALVDHALRRRFAFLELPPNYGALRKFHSHTGFPTDRLIEVLRDINRAIADPHYALGTSYFLNENLAIELPDIWEMEIEQYLREFFFDRPTSAEEYGWDRVRARLDL